MSTGWVCIALLTGGIAGQAPADALDEAKTYFRAGQQAYEAGYFLDAARAFERAYDLVPNPAITFSLGQTYRQQFYVDRDPGHLRRAIQSYRQYLREVPRGGRRDDAIDHLSDLEQQRLALGLPPVEARGPNGGEESRTQIMVTSATDGARARLDDGEPKEVPLVAEVEPGEHRVTVEAEGHFPQAVRAVAIEGRLVVSQVDLRPKPALLSVQAPRGARIAVDGRPVGDAPMQAPLRLAAGRHLVTASRDGYHPFREEVEIGRGGEARVIADLETTAQRELSYWFLGGGGVLMVSTGVLVVVALASEGQARLILSKRDDEMMNLTRQELQDYVDARDRRNDLLTVSSAALAGSVIVGGIGAALFFLDDAQPAVAPGGFTPIVTPDGAGMSWRAAF